MSKKFKDPKIYLKLMVSHAITSKLYFQEADRETFFQQKQDFDAICMQLSQLGEQVSCLEKCDENIIIKFAQNAEWAQLKGLRNKIGHNYGKINPDIIWQFLEEEIEDLILSLQRIIKNRYGETFP